LVVAVNLAWLLPFACWAALHEEHALLTLLALAPLALACLLIGSGRR
jgi:hypothetical protein